MADSIYTSPVAFYFKLQFESGSGIADESFSEISGLSVEVETEEIVEGGENRYGHRIPKKSKHSNLVCKRALAPLKGSKLSSWIEGIVNGDSSTKIIPYNLSIYLMGVASKEGEMSEPLIGWYFSGVYPVKWAIGAFDSKKNELATETMEFAYNTIKRTL